MKTFVDGAVSGGTCLLEQPAVGATGHGLARMTREDLAQVVREIHRAGRRACVHANGDRAIAWVLEAIEAAQRADPRPDARHRIEHASVMNPALLDRMRDLGVAAVPFANYVLAHGDKLRGLYTTGAAFASVEEDHKGGLAAGYLADFAVLERDPRTVSVDELNHIAVRSTWVGGAPVWESDT